jgi:hypothetical protein
MAQVLRIKQMADITLRDVELVYRHERRSNVKAALRLLYIALKTESDAEAP